MSSKKLAYAASGALTITLGSLATASTWLAGRQSTAIDNTSNLYLDYHLSGVITVGTTPTINTEIRVYVASMLSDSVWPDTLGAADAAATIVSAGASAGFLKLAAVLPVDSTTSNRPYYFGKVSVAQLFGGVCPPKFVVYVTHNTGVNLNSTGGNHVITAAGIYSTDT